jgi:hypothetical protein
MAGTAPAPAKTETKTENAEPVQTTPLTFKQRLERLAHEIFKGREEFAGWRQ